MRLKKVEIQIKSMKFIFHYKAYVNWSKAYAEISDLASNVAKPKVKGTDGGFLPAVDHMN